MQDIHWAVGSFGYFPSYALGAVIAAQLNEGLRRDVPDLDEQILARDEPCGAEEPDHSRSSVAGVTRFSSRGGADSCLYRSRSDPTPC